MFVPVKPFQRGLLFVGKARRSLPYWEVAERYSWVGSGLTHKNRLIWKMLERDKLSSLFEHFVREKVLKTSFKVSILFSVLVEC